MTAALPFSPDRALEALAAGTLAQLVYSSLLFALVALICWRLTPRRPGLRHALWALVVIRLLLPPALSAPWSLGGLGESIVDALPGGDRGAASEAVHGEKTGEFTAVDGPVAPLATEGRVHQPTPNTLGLALVIVWFGGALFQAARFVRSRRRLSRYLDGCDALTDSALQARILEWRERLGLARPVRTVIGDGTLGPFTLGSLRPVIHLPRHLVESSSPAVLESVVSHELAHVRRFDDLWIQLTSLVQCAFFFHPVVWLVAPLMTRCREEACDELVLREGTLSRHEYAHGLLEVVAHGLVAPRPSASFLDERKSLMHRIQRILALRANDQRTVLPPFAWAIFAGVLLLPMAPAATPADPVGEAPAAEAQREPIPLSNPLPEGELTSSFGPRIDPFEGERRLHPGVDVKAATGTPIRCAANGVVVHLLEDPGAQPGWGLTILIDHGGGVSTRYGHLGTVEVGLHQRVVAGETVATVGMSGLSTGPHLHFEVLVDGDPVNPSDFGVSW